MIILSKEAGPFDAGVGTFDCSSPIRHYGLSTTGWTDFKTNHQFHGLSVGLCIPITTTETDEEGVETTRIRHDLYPSNIVMWSQRTHDIRKTFHRIQVPMQGDLRTGQHDTIDVMVDWDGDGTNPTFTVNEPIVAGWELLLLGIGEV